MAFIKQIPQDSALFRQQLGQYAKRPDGIKLPLDVIRQARLPEHLCPLKRFAYLLLATRADEVAAAFKPLLGDPRLAHAVLFLIYKELEKARNKWGEYEQVV